VSKKGRRPRVLRVEYRSNPMLHFPRNPGALFSGKAGTAQAWPADARSSTFSTSSPSPKINTTFMTVNLQVIIRDKPCTAYYAP
jgi:hypothetical protein